MYSRTLQPSDLVLCFMGAMVLRLPGLRAVANRSSATLGTANFSSLSHALCRPSSLAMVRRMVEQLCSRYAPRSNELIAIDSMALSLPKTRRHRCKKMNNHTVGGGVLWSFRLQAQKGQSPIQIHQVMQGAWHDSRLIECIHFVARGPIYLMDRGFYAFETLNRLLDLRVRFIVRARKRSLVYQTLRTLSSPRRLGSLTLTEDARVRLGAQSAASHPVVRLIRATPAQGEEIILLTNLLNPDAEFLLATYKQRWKIERFHKLLKETLGLAHLYSFHQNGLVFLLYVALLLALLLFLGSDNKVRQTLQVMHHAVKQLRKELEIENPWKRNIYSKRKSRK